MAITKVNGPYTNNTQSTPNAGTLGWTPTAGNLLVAVVSIKSSGSPNPVITETNVTWTKQKEYQNSQDFNAYVGIYVGVVGASPSTSVSVDHGGDGSPYQFLVAIVEYSGLKTSGFLDVSASNKNTKVNKACDSGTTGTTTVADELWVAGFCYFSGTGGNWDPNPPTPTHSFAVEVATYPHYNNTILGFFDKIVGATGTADTGATVSVSSWWVGCVICLEASSGASYSHTFTDKVGCKGSKARLAGRFRSFTGKVGGKDVFSRLKAMERVFTDKLGGKGTFTHVMSTVNQFIHVFMESLGGKDSLSRFKTVIRSFVNNIGGLDSKSRFKGVVRVFIDKVGGKDSFSRTVSRFREFTNKVGGKDSFFRTVFRFREFTNKIGGKDSLTRVMNGVNQFVHVFMEGLGGKDSLSRFKSMYRVFITKLGDKDSLSRFKSMYHVFTIKLGAMDSLKGHTLTMGSFKWTWGEHPVIMVNNEDK